MTTARPVRNTRARVIADSTFSGERHQRIPAAILVRNSTLTVDQRRLEQVFSGVQGPRAVVPDRRTRRSYQSADA